MSLKLLVYNVPSQIRLHHPFMHAISISKDVKKVMGHIVENIFEVLRTEVKRGKQQLVHYWVTNDKLPYITMSRYYNVIYSMIIGIVGI